MEVSPEGSLTAKNVSQKERNSSLVTKIAAE